MQVLNSWLQRQIAVCLVMLLGVPIGTAETLEHSTSRPAAPPRSGTFADMCVVMANPLPFFPASLGATWAQTAEQNQQPAAPQGAQTNQQNSSPAPAGTAASPYEKPGGAPASRPAGAAIAPGKQRHIHTFSIRVALLVGAAVAIGVVTAASLSSPSRAN